MIKALMLDVDGVVVRGRPADGARWDYDLEADLGVSPAALQESFFKPHWRDIVLGRAGLRDLLGPVLSQIAPSIEPADFLAYWFANDAAIDEALLAAAGHCRAAGLRVFLCTNQEHERAAHLMDGLGLGAHADGIFYSAALGAMKPEPGFFNRVAGGSGLSPGEMLLIDDSAANVAAAQGVGWHAVQWTGEAALAGEFSELVEFGEAERLPVRLEEWSVRRR